MSTSRSRSLPTALLLLLLVATPAQAQEPDLNILALTWLRGDWAAPMLCEIDGEPTRGVRRLRVSADRRRAFEHVARLSFFDLAAPGATRCFDELGGEQPQVRGSVTFRLDGPSRPDLARRDFQQALRRDGGFSFRIDSGKLLLEPVDAADAGEPRVVDFSGGTLRAHAVKPGSDAARLLADFPQPRKVTFELEARDGTLLRLYAVGH